jgi:CBS domain containing-hemolysin-like protein
MDIDGPFRTALDFPRQESIPFVSHNLTLLIVLLIVSVVAYSLVNSIEIAVVAVNRIRVRHLAEGGSKSAQALERLRSNQDRFFAAIVLLANLFVVLASSIGGVLAVEAAGGYGLLISTVGVTLVIAIFGELAPKVLAARAAERYALIVARPVEALTLLMRPVVAALIVVPNLFSRLFFGQRLIASPTVTEAELRMLIDIGAAEGAVAEREAELLERVFQFRDRLVNEIMVPRTEVVWLETGTTINHFYALYGQHPHSRFPVFNESIDNVTGVVGIKDVLRAVSRDEVDDNSPIESCMRPTLFVPETKRIGSLFWEMQREGQQMAVVVDEYGGTAGIVTMELLLEEIVGELGDELRPREREFEAVDERTIQVDGGMSIHDANEQLDLGLPEGEYETVAGFVLSLLGHIPREGEQVIYNTAEGGRASGPSLRLVVTEMHGRKIERVLVQRL